MQTYNNWQFKVDNHIATMTINRPKALNSLSTDTLMELKAISEHIQANDDIWAVIVEGTGEHFCAGADVKSFQKLFTSSKEVFQENLRAGQLCLDAFEAVHKPKIAKIQGYCIGAGLLLAAMCDFRISTNTASFSLPEIKRGIAVIMGTARITKLIGIANTKEIALLGENFGVEEATYYGLLNPKYIVSTDKLEETTLQFADKFRYLPPRTVQIANQIIDEGLAMDNRGGQELEIELQSNLLGSPDWMEALMSFFQKRLLKYIGR